MGGETKISNQRILHISPQQILRAAAVSAASVTYRIPTVRRPIASTLSSDSTAASLAASDYSVHYDYKGHGCFYPYKHGLRATLELGWCVLCPM